MISRLRFRGPHRAHDDVIEILLHIFDVLGPMDGTTHEKWARCDRSHVCRRNGIAAQVNAVGPAAKCYVEAVVHDNERACAVSECEDVSHESRELASFEIPFPDLNDINGDLYRVAQLRQQTPPSFFATTASICESQAIRDQVDDHRTGS